MKISIIKTAEQIFQDGAELLVSVEQLSEDLEKSLKEASELYEVAKLKGEEVDLEKATEKNQEVFRKMINKERMASRLEYITSIIKTEEIVEEKI